MLMSVTFKWRSRQCEVTHVEKHKKRNVWSSDTEMFEKNVTDYNALHLMFQKSLPVGGYIAAGFYHGMSDLRVFRLDGSRHETAGVVHVPAVSGRAHLPPSDLQAA